MESFLDQHHHVGQPCVHLHCSGSAVKALLAHLPAGNPRPNRHLSLVPVIPARQKHTKGDESWIRKNIIDIDEQRSNWFSNKKTSKKKSILEAAGSQINGVKIKRVQTLPPNNKLIINCNILQTANCNYKLHEIVITKRYLAIIKNKDYECAVQVKALNHIIVFKISAKQLYKIFVENFDNFSYGLHDQFWHFRINITNAKICNAIGRQDIEFSRCSVYELKEELPSTPLGDYTQIPGMNLCVSKA